MNQKQTEEFRPIVRVIFDNMHREDLVYMGKIIFDSFTDSGIPPEIILDELEKKNKFSKEEKISIIYNFQKLFIEHKIKSGIGEKRLNKVRENNINILIKLYKTGEFETF